MGKNGKKQRHQQNPTSRLRHSHYNEEEDYEDSFNDSLPFCPSHLSIEQQQQEEEQEEDNNNNNNNNNNEDGKSNFDFIIPSKFSLYQQSVQSPKGDISYLQKFFLMYVGGRVPLHLQEDFCGTALLSTEWIRTDPRRTAIGVDLDLEALTWSLENNLNKHNDENTPRISLFHGNVLEPHESTLLKPNPELLIRKLSLKDDEEASLQPVTKGYFALPARDIVCAFNYSCCCLHSRKELVVYFEHARDALSKRGGIFVMDLYGGTSSERELKLQRKFPNFTYTWEQAEFDVIQRKTRISLHYQLYKPQKKIRNAFSYSWRVWSLPEIRDCLEEAGFKFVHFWIRAMPDTDQNRNSVGFGASRDDKYEEVTNFVQQDAWNAYVVAVA